MNRGPDRGAALPARVGARLRARLDTVVVVAAVLWLSWPAAMGVMPRSADHLVHLQRIAAQGEALAQLRLHAWTPIWYFGVPLGDLYPVLGDLLVATLRGVGWLAFDAIDWEHAYALGMVVVLAVQGLAMLRVGRTLGLGPAVGVLAALLLLLDPGEYREGGWIYGIEYGVWPQSLASALTWLGFAELTAAEPGTTPGVRRPAIARAALSFAGALLAHPMSLVGIALGATVFAVVYGRRHRDRLGWWPVLAVAIAIAGGLAAFQLVATFSYAGWMASYGWLGEPLAAMTRRALHGEATRGMAGVIGAACAVGLSWAAFAGGTAARFVAAFALLSWLAASADLYVALRPDRIASGFAQIQYQRFLILAKPGLFVLAGAALALPVRAAIRLGEGGSRARPRSLAAAAIALFAIAWVGHGAVESARAHGVGRWPVDRPMPAGTSDADYTDLIRFLRERAELDGDFFRVAVIARRNDHFYVDLPLHTGVPVHKVGFLPGDNFVHKPESADPRVLDALGVRYVVRILGAAEPGSRLVATFGTLRVLERDVGRFAIATLDGEPAETVLDAPGEIRVVAHAAGRLRFSVAGYPRWELEGPEGPVPWFEVPVVGDAEPVDPVVRASGRLAGGKALGDDGSEPMLVAADVVPGTYVLRYRAWTRRDLLGLLLAVLAAAAVGVALRRPEGALCRRIEAFVRRLARPGLALALGLAAMLVVGIRIQRARADEAGRLVGRLDGAEGLHTSVLKVDMLLRPVARPVGRDPAETVVTGLRRPPVGWIALDDDDGKSRNQGGWTLMLDVRGADGAWRNVLQRRVAHRPGRQPIALDTGAVPEPEFDLRIRLLPTGTRPPRVGLDLDLEEAP